MLITMAGLLSMLLVILFAAMLFTNALEHLGNHFKISEGVTGSLFAAIGTALPETLIPILALMSSRSLNNQEISVGAILGAPLMLATLSTCLMGFAALRKRKINGILQPESTGFLRDMRFFIAGYVLSTLAMFVPHVGFIRYVISALLVGNYCLYLKKTLNASAVLVAQGHGTEVENMLWLSRLGLPEKVASIVLQLVLALIILLLGSDGFIHYVTISASLLNVSTLFLSLMIIPIATELPEKINSILWINKGKDTLAFGNITGAMTFQGNLLPAIGIALTPWQPRHEVSSSLIITLLAAFWLYFLAKRKNIRVWHLMLNGMLYILYLSINLL